ncbi:MAG: peptidyl-prolyl cis-trans isomerase [Proteobacteria bacterium]|nr:peptidyl-prolyl cis-trans isomerase [Pseudomonadota bacterium]
MKRLALVLATLLVTTTGFTTGSHAAAKTVSVELHTSKGKITLELYPDKAPVTVENFLKYARAKKYDGTIFHRVIKNFMIQGGGMTADMKERAAFAPITNEADNGLKNNKGTIAMARTNAPHSASSQFFINTKDNGFLDHRDKSMRGWGYTVFGKVTKGMKTVMKIDAVKTRHYMGHGDVPAKPVTIRKVVILSDKKKAK